MRGLCAKLSELYGVPKPKVALRPSAFMGPHYNSRQNRIVLTKPSLVSFLHEFAHHILHSHGKTQNEEFPRAFSLGLFKKIAPLMFEKAKSEGRLLFV